MAGKESSAKDAKAKTKGMGCLGRLVIIVLVLLIAAYAAAKLFFPAERVRAEIIRRASESLGRPVELDGVSLGLLPTPSLELRGLRIFNPEDFPGGEFVSIDELGCGLKILPLLSKKFEFTEISLVHPVVRLRKTADGRVNYSFEITAEDQPIQTPVGPRESVSSEEAALTAFGFDWAEIRGGDIMYQDDSSETTVTLNNFSLETRLRLDAAGTGGSSMGTLQIPSIKSELIPNNLPLNIVLTYNADIDFQHADLVLRDTRLELNGIVFDIEGTVRNLLDPVSIFAKLTTDGVSIEPLLDYLPPMESIDRDKLRLAGTISGSVETRLEPKSDRDVFLGGRFTFGDLSLGYATVATKAHFESLRLDFDTDSISFAGSGGSLSDREFDLSGTVSGWDDLKYAVALRGAYDLAGLVPFLDAATHDDVKGLATFNLKAAGKKSDWVHTRLDGTVALDRLYYNNDSLTSALERLDMFLVFKGQNIAVDSMYAEYPGVKLSLKGTVKNGYAHLLEPQEGHKKPHLDFTLTAPLVNYDILLPEEAEPATAASPAAAGTPTTPGATGGESAGQAIQATAPVFIPDISAAGDIRVNTFVFREVRITDLTGRVEYDNGLITYRDARGTVYSGQVTSSGSVDITDMYQPLVVAQYDAKNIEANDFLSQFANLPGHLFGKFNAAGQLSGRGSEPVDFLRTVSAQSNVDMKEGRVVNFDLIKKLADQFGFKTFEEEKLHELVTDIVIKDGRLLLDGTRLFNRVGDWDVGGAVAFVDEALDLQVSLYMSPEYSKDVKLLGGLLQDGQGRVRVNFTIGGSFTSPNISNISTDNEVVKKKVEEKAKEEVKKLFKGLFKK